MLARHADERIGIHRFAAHDRFLHLFRFEEQRRGLLDQGAVRLAEVTIKLAFKALNEVPETPSVVVLPSTR